MTTLLRVLVVEDAEDDAFLLLRELASGGYDLTHLRVDTVEALREALHTQVWDLVISDFSLPTLNALDVLKVLAASGLDLPCIVISGTIEEEAAVDALRSGANDFIVKERLSRLLPAVARELREAAGRRQRRAAEIALDKSRHRMRFALEAAGVGTWESDIKSGKTEWSDVLERLHGQPPGSFGGTFEAFIEAIHPHDRQRVLDLIAQSLRDHTESRVEYRVTWPDGSIHWIAGVGQSFYDEAGQPVRAAGVGMDITVQKHLEEQFRQAQKMESIGNLAGGISHDFNNLLSIVTGYCDLLAERFVADTAATEDLAEIRRASASATALTRQLLAFSRKQILAPQVVNLNDTLADFQNMLSRLLEENVRIDFRLAPDLAPVDIDPGQIEQVLLNLAVNARDAMPHGGVLTIETANVTLDESYAQMHVDVQPGAYVALSVSDTGSGMSLDVQARLFEPFFTTKEKGGGTGLGLATVFGIVKQSRGHIWVYSELGMGTTFKLYLPVASSPHVEVPTKRTQASADLAGIETILVVEDADSLRLLSEKILKRYGYTVLLAANGDEAQRVCLDHPDPIHVVLADVIIPGGSGRTIADWITRHRPETKIIYMSGYTDNAIVHHGVLDPGTAFLQKPFSPEALARKVREVLA
jgi:hypothetical protein